MLDHLCTLCKAQNDDPSGAWLLFEASSGSSERRSPGPGGSEGEKTSPDVARFLDDALLACRQSFKGSSSIERRTHARLVEVQGIKTISPLARVKERRLSPTSPVQSAGPRGNRP